MSIEKHKTSTVAEYRCNDCMEVFTEKFVDEEPHDFYPCPLCDDGEGKRVEL